MLFKAGIDAVILSASTAEAATCNLKLFGVIIFNTVGREA